MKCVKRLLALVLALVLCMAVFVVPGAQAESGVKARFGAFAAKAGDKLFMALPVNSAWSLYSMPAQGGVLTLIDTATHIDDVISDANGNVYYLRYNGSVYQVMMRAADGTRTVAAQFNAGDIAHTLSLYAGQLYCLVNGCLNAIDLTANAAVQVSDIEMTAYAIADGIVYYESAVDQAEYQVASRLQEGSLVQGSSGRLYSMMLDGSSNMMLFDQGTSVLSAYGEYVYFHNLNDSYIVSSDTQEWLDGCLYRINVQTNQYIKVLSQYDWSYRPTDYGLVVYREKSLVLSDLSGENPLVIYEPDLYNYMAILDDCVIVYEYNLKKLTSISLADHTATILYSGDFVSDGTSGELNNVTGGAADDTTLATPVPVDSATAQPSTDATAQPSTDVTAQPQITAQPTATPVPGYTASGAMTIGASGEAVRAMQKRLVELGYLKSADGIFGEKTQKAVKAFQKAAGLTVDGLVGNATLKALGSDDAPYAPSTGTDDSYIFPNSSSVKLTREDVLSIDKSLWPYARNEIYARHGYIFEKSKFADYFASKSWYTAGGFSTKSLNAVEWYNMELISAMEKEYASSSSSSSSATAAPAATATPAPTAKPESSSTAYDSLPDAVKAIGSDQYIFPDSSTVKLTKEQIRAIDKSLLPYARNEIYARHGYSFTKSSFKAYFGAKSWYKAGGFSTKDLNETEWYNMELIAWVEKNG